VYEKVGSVLDLRRDAALHEVPAPRLAEGVEGQLLLGREVQVVGAVGLHVGHPRLGVAVVGLRTLGKGVTLLAEDLSEVIHGHGCSLAGVAGEGHVYL